jgi:hypothetical protein
MGYDMVVIQVFGRLNVNILSLLMSKALGLSKSWYTSSLYYDLAVSISLA